MKRRWRRHGAPVRRRPDIGQPTSAQAISASEVRMTPTQPSSPIVPARTVQRAVESPVVRGGLTLVAGVLTGNLLGFGRVALTAYFLGTHSRADSLAQGVWSLD